MEIGKLYYKFKICVTLKEFTRALTFLESVTTYIEELSSQDVDLLLSLKKGLLKQHKDCLLTVKEERNKINKFIFKSVLEDYSDTVNSVTANSIECFISCLNSLVSKAKEAELAATLHVIRAKLFNFIAHNFPEDRSKYLQLAYCTYKVAVQIAIKDLNKLNFTRLKIFHSYCKFVAGSVKDSYRSMLFCINVMEELHASKIQEDDNPESITHTPEFEDLENKLRQFYESNLVEYNISLRKYHPEYREI